MNIYKIEGFKPEFRDMTEVEIYGIEKIIDTLQEDGDFDFTCEDLGLAYTSSGGYPTYNVCNGRFDYEENEISHFAITENGRLYMITHDEEENENLYIIE